MIRHHGHDSHATHLLSTSSLSIWHLCAQRASLGSASVDSMAAEAPQHQMEPNSAPQHGALHPQRRQEAGREHREHEERNPPAAARGARRRLGQRLAAKADL
eukprot:scaffold35731_cov63-Phaeocystis_antarctica.AAC.1